MDVPPVFGPDREARFLSMLRPADVLIFDKLGLPGGLVQWGDECPANHVALVTDAQHAIEANVGTPAVREVSVASYFDGPTVRTVTLLRHVDLRVDAGVAAQAVVDRARKDRGDNEYANLDVFPIGLLAVHRMYGPELKRRLGSSVQWILEKMVDRLRARIPDDQSTLTCSEFVYRCFTEAVPPLPVQILNPLITNARDFSSRSVVNEPDFRDVQRLWLDIIDRNESRGVKPVGDPGDPRADAVSPGDLWRSSSLVPVAAFHRPPERPWPRWPSQPPDDPPADLPADPPAGRPADDDPPASAAG